MRDLLQERLTVDLDSGADHSTDLCSGVDTISGYYKSHHLLLVVLSGQHTNPAIYSFISSVDTRRCYSYKEN